MIKYNVEQISHSLSRCRLIPLLNGEQENRVFMERLAISFLFSKIACSIFFFASFKQKDHINRHIIIISKSVSVL